MRDGCLHFFQLRCAHFLFSFQTPCSPLLSFLIHLRSNITMVSQGKPSGIPMTPVFINYAVAQGVPRVGALARRIHGWTWQAVSYIPPSNIQSFCINVHHSVSHWYGHWCGLRDALELERACRVPGRSRNSILLLKHCSVPLELDDPPHASHLCDLPPYFPSPRMLMLHLSFSVYPKKALRLLTDPATSIFVPLIVRLSFPTHSVLLTKASHRSFHSPPSLSAPSTTQFHLAMLALGSSTGSSGTQWFWPSPRTTRLTFGLARNRVYVTFALITCFTMLMIWFNKPHDLAHFSPAYAFLVCLYC